MTTTTTPIAPDGKYHYFIGFSSSLGVGGAPVATDRPILATGNMIETIRAAISSERGLGTVTFTSIHLLAAPQLGQES
jgi:hypothetical protein